MRKSKFTEEQIAYAVKQIEAGVPVDELCRKYGVHKNTIYRCGPTPDLVPRVSREFELRDAARVVDFEVMLSAAESSGNHGSQKTLQETARG